MSDRPDTTTPAATRGRAPAPLTESLFDMDVPDA